MANDRDVLIQVQTLVNAQLAGAAPAPTGVIHVASGGDLQAAINAASAGAVLSVDPGDYAPITIPKPLTIKSSAALPNRRIAAADSPGLFVRITSTGQPAMTMTAPAMVFGVHGSRTDNAPPVVAVRGDWTPADGIATLNQCWFLGLDLGNRRGVELNGCGTVLSQSRVENMWCQGQDAQAAGGWTGPGPFTLDDCYFEGSTETVMFGGGDPSDAAHSPKNLILRKSTLTKQLGWRAKTGMVKTALELKNMVGFLIEDNVIEYSWVDAQVGFLLMLTPRNQSGGAPYSNVANGVIQRNLFRHGAAGMNVLATDNLAPSGRLTNVQILNNRFEDIDSSGTPYGRNGKLCQILVGPDALTIDHNTFVGVALNSFLSFGNNSDTVRTTNFKFTNNFVMEGSYGLFGDAVGVGVPALTLFAPNALWQNVAVIKQAPRSISYPPTTQYVADEAAALALHAGATGYPTGV